MALEIALRSPSLIPSFLQAGNGEPRKVHWVGNTQPAQPGQSQDQGGKHNNDAPKQKSSRGYRDLSTITLGEVDAAYKRFASQLAPSPYPAWVAPNYFCMIHLTEKEADRPPALFGRVKTCYPSDGQIQNIREMELYFPRVEAKPDTVLLRAGDIASAESYCVRVKFLMSPEEATEFAKYEALFTQQGFMPEFSQGYIDLLDVTENDQQSLPWTYVIGSRWYASIPYSMQPEIREKLTKFLQWKKRVFNYHPEWLPPGVRSLNRELGFKAGFTPIHLFEPENAQQTIYIVTKSFDESFFFQESR